MIPWGNCNCLWFLEALRDSAMNCANNLREQSWGERQNTLGLTKRHFVRNSQGASWAISRRIPGGIAERTTEVHTNGKNSKINHEMWKMSREKFWKELKEKIRKELGCNPEMYDSKNSGIISHANFFTIMSRMKKVAKFTAYSKYLFKSKLHRLY